MKFLTKSVVAAVGVLMFILNLACLINADTFSHNGTHPDYPGGCFYDNTIYEPGEHIVRRLCTKITCGLNGWISGHNCLQQAPQPGCRGGELATHGRPYPECCIRKYICVDPETGEEYVDLDF